jgi:glycosyltransferase involved in cell wall biosynthesis
MEEITLCIIGGCVILLLLFINLSCNNKEGYKSTGKGQMKITAIVLNHNRPHNIKPLIDEIEKYEEIVEIILLNGKKETVVDITSEKTKSVNDFTNNNIYGGARRFLVKDFKGDYVLYIDDDMIPSHKFVKDMIKELDNGSPLVGNHGRSCNKGGYNGGDADTVLTGMCMIPRIIIEGYKTEFEKNYKSFLKSTHGNGEDLSMNHYIRDIIGKKPTLIEGNVKGLDNSQGYSSDKSHYILRDVICRMLFK